MRTDVCFLKYTNVLTSNIGYVRKKLFDDKTAVKTYILRSSMSERRFNNCFILHVHKELAECINLVVKKFISRNDQRVRYFGTFPSS